jgi:hypothetical protein
VTIFLRRGRWPNLKQTPAPSQASFCVLPATVRLSYSNPLSVDEGEKAHVSKSLAYNSQKSLELEERATDLHFAMPTPPHVAKT